MTKSYGIVYIATGEQFVREAQESIKSVRSVMPSIPVVLITDEKISSPHIDQVIQIENPRYDYLDKAANLEKSPFDRTLLLDTDTYVTEDISEIFTLLDQFDMAAAHAPLGVSCTLDIPDAYPEFNTDVIAFQNSESVKKVISKWCEIGKEGLEGDMPHDQPSFRQAVYNSSLNVATLPPRYNFRTISPNYANGNVKIIHGRNIDPELYARSINHADVPKVQVITRYSHKVITNEAGFVFKFTLPEIIDRLWTSLSQKGVKHTFRRSIEKLFT